MSTLAETMKANALEAMKLTRKHFVVELDFSEGTVAQLDGLADDVEFSLKGGLSDENIELLARTWGSYLGEVIQRNIAGEWREAADGRPVLSVAETELDPQDAVRRRLTDAAKPSLAQFYSEVPRS